MTRFVLASLLAGSLVAGSLVGGCSHPVADPKDGAGARGLAVISGDGESTAAVSLVDPQTAAVTRDDCIDSMSTDPTLLVPLSGDLVLPSTPTPDHALVLIDRANATLNWLAPDGCQVQRQLSVSSGFVAAPHDLAVISTAKAYVTRYNANPAPGTNPNLDDQGNDLIVIDPTTGAILRRIDLSAEATSETGATLLARPDRLLYVGGKLYVTLGEASDDLLFTGPARLLQIDPATDSIVNSVDMPTFKSCSGLDYLSATNILVVGCLGDVNETYDNRVAQAGLVLVTLGGAAPAVKTSVPSSAAGGQLLAGFAVSGDDAVFGATVGDGVPGALWSFELDNASADQVLPGSAPDSFGGIAWDAATQRLFAADYGAAAPVVRVFAAGDQLHVTQKSSFAADPALGLPPRVIGWY